MPSWICGHYSHLDDGDNRHRVRGRTWLALRAAILLLVGLTLSTPKATADSRHDPVGNGRHTKSAGGFTVEVCGHSYHEGPHSNAQTPRLDSVQAIGTYPSGALITVSGTKYAKMVTWAKITTPFAGTLRAANAEEGETEAGQKYFELTWPSRNETYVYAEATWDHKIIGAKGNTLLQASCYMAVVDAGEGPAGHIVRESEKKEVESVSQLTGPLVNELRIDGRPEIDTATGWIEHDANGDIVWDVAPEVGARLTSDVTYNATTGLHDFTYTLDNLTDRDLDFLLSEIKTTSYPSGWSGTVDADDSVSITVSAVTSDHIYTERSQLTLDHAGDPDQQIGSAVMHYSPVSALAYNGTAAIVTIGTDVQSHTNTVTFNVVGAPSDGAYLYRTDASGQTELAASVSTALSIGTHTITDSDYGPGENEYEVITGSGVNNYVSDPASVTN